MARANRGADEPTIVKKYANRRLYDTGQSTYVTLDDLCEMIKEGHEFVVQDAKTAEDITRSVLTQIIVEQEGRGEQNLLPTSFLRKLIGFYGDNIQTAVPNYLEQTMEIFTKNQERMREQMSTMQGMMPKVPGVPGVPTAIPNAQAIEDMNRKNMEMFERTMNNTMKMFTPFGSTNVAGNAAGSAAGNENAQGTQKQAKIHELKKNIEALEKEIDRIAAE